MYDKAEPRTNKLLTALLIFTSTILVTSLAITIFISVSVYKLNSQIDNTSLEDKPLEVEYLTVSEIYENQEKYINTYCIIGGYFCKEFGTNIGLAWLTDKKESSKDTVERLIRLEQAEPIEYTPKAIAVYGKLELTNDKSLVIKNGDFYLYGGTDNEMLKHNALLSADIVTTVTTALLYDNAENLHDKFEELKLLSCTYNDEILEEILADIDELHQNKSNLNQEEFELEAEQLWNSFRAQLLNK